MCPRLMAQEFHFVRTPGIYLQHKHTDARLQTTESAFMARPRECAADDMHTDGDAGRHAASKRLTQG